MSSSVGQGRREVHPRRNRRAGRTDPSAGVGGLHQRLPSVLRAASDPDKVCTDHVTFPERQGCVPSGVPGTINQTKDREGMGAPLAGSSHFCEM